MKTFNNDKSLKEGLIKKLKHHQELDAFIQGKWITEEKIEENGYKGCFYGCTMQTNKNPIGKFSKKYGVDLWYCFLTERIFEGLPKGEFEKFPVQSIETLPVGFDINKIKSEFFYRLLMDKNHGQINYCSGNKECEDAIRQCADFFKQDFDKIKESAARSAARSAAWSAESAARSAAWSAESAARSAESAARSAESAESAAWSAESAARSAARSAESAAWSAWSAAWSAKSAAKSEHYIWLRDMLFECINQVKKDANSKN